MLRAYESEISLEGTEPNLQYTSLHEIDLKTPLIETDTVTFLNEPESEDINSSTPLDQLNPADAPKDISTRIHDTAVYAGGKAGYYISGPIAVYALYPVAQSATVPIVAAASSALAVVPVSWPFLGVMTLTAGLLIPKVVAQPTTIQNTSQTIGESVTTKLLSGSKTVITYAYNASSSAVGSLWRKPETPAHYTPLDSEYEDLEAELLVVNAPKASYLLEQ